MYFDSVIAKFLVGKKVDRAFKRAILWKNKPTAEQMKIMFGEFKFLSEDQIKTVLEDITLNTDERIENVQETDRKYERFIYSNTPAGIVTIAISYSLEKEEKMKFADFVLDALTRVVDKLSNPVGGLFKVFVEKPEYHFVRHENARGFITERISTFEEGVREQEKYSYLSSCIVVLDNGKKTVHSVRHPLQEGWIIPDFHGFILGEKSEL